MSISIHPSRPAVPMLRTVGLSRAAFGLALVAHALAHSAPAIWLSYHLPDLVVTPLWLVATLGLTAAGLGVWGMPPFARRWRELAVSGAVASLLLLGATSLTLALAGAVIDVPLLVLASFWRPEHAPRPALATIWRRFVRAFGIALGWIALVYAGVAIISRPWHTTWGTTLDERRMPLIGDEITPGARYQMDHAVTIAAPADSVWPWLAQLGQDRGGFYSYAWLERLVGDDIRNADRIQPEWQRRDVGDLVRAAQRDYLGGRFGDLGWRVVQLEPGRAMVLGGWGAFALRPQPDGTTRFHIRLRGPGTPTVLGVVFGPLNAYAFEPAHFIMERGMMLGVERRAEAMLRH